MALYFTSRLSGDGQPLPGLLATHDRLPLVACGWTQTKVTISTDDGEKVASIARNTVPTQLLWHPVLGILIIGWRDGALTSWSEETGDVTQPATSQHDSLAVTVLAWTSQATFLLTGSKSCTLAMWQLDGARPVSLWSARTDTPITKAVHLSFPQAGDDDIIFAVTGNKNLFYVVDDSQQVVQLITLDRDACCASMIWEKKRRNLIVLTNSNVLSLYHIDLDLKANCTMTRKISSGPKADLSILQMVQVAEGLVATCCGDSAVKLFNLDQDVMYILPFPSAAATIVTSTVMGLEQITGIAAHEAKKLLCAATKDGEVVMWQYTGPAQSTEPDDWQKITSTQAEGEVSLVRICGTGPICALLPSAAIIFQEALRKRKWTGVMAVVQTSAEGLLVSVPASQNSASIISHSRIRGVDIGTSQVAVWTGQLVEVYNFTESTGTSTKHASYPQTSGIFAMHNDGLFLTQEQKVVFQDNQGKTIDQISFTDAEGVPSGIDVAGDFVAVISTRNVMKVARIYARELKAVGPPRPLFQDAGGKVAINSLKINPRGKKVALLTLLGAAAKNDTRVFVYDLQTDQLHFYDFSEVREVPISVFWNISRNAAEGPNEKESLLFCCELRGGGFEEAEVSLLDADQNMSFGDQEREGETSKSGSRVATLFAAPNGVVVHHEEPLRTDEICVIGLTVPNYIMCVEKKTDTSHSYSIEQKKLRDFQGMQHMDDVAIRDALLEFSYFTTIGNMDEAFRAVKTIKDAGVWQNLAKLCVSTGRLDVAEVCLANMQDGVAARALRESASEPELEARLAILAISLGMNEKAEKLLRKCKRFDLFTEFLVSAGKWEAARKHAEQHDRIRIRPVLYRHAQHMEACGNFEMAVKLYEEAMCAPIEVPRMMFQMNRLPELKRATMSLKDKDMLIWWAQYSESIGDQVSALECYEMAGDYFNTIRTLIFQKQIEKAIEIAMDPQLPNAAGGAYFVGAYYEAKNDVTKALKYFTHAGAFKHAIKLAKDNDLFSDVVALALRADDPQTSMECAVFFEERAMFEKAVQLYQKAGDTKRAMDVCIKGGLFDILHQISETLDSAADPESFLQMAEHFINNQLYDKAVQMLVFAKAFNEALQICTDKNVTLTEEMAEAMTLPKCDNQEDEEYRLSLLKRVAKVAKVQGNFSLACKKYTQAGERVKAIKMLMRTGDTEKIVFFANHSRNAEIYVLAGNYLQSQKWQADTTIYKNIVTFYTKAKAYESLAGFYDAAAQVQIDEFREYDTALMTLREAQKVLDKGDVSLTKKQQLASRIQIIESFVNARRMIKPGEPCNDMVAVCTDLLDRAHRDSPDHDLIESSLRIGDVYALLVEYYEKLGQSQNAFSLVMRMREQDIVLTYFLEQGLVERICRATGHDAEALMGLNQDQRQNVFGDSSLQADGGAGDFVEEEVE